MQFLSPFYSQRTDGYGGSLANRAVGEHVPSGEHRLTCTACHKATYASATCTPCHGPGGPGGH